MGVKMRGSREQGGKNVREQGAHIINLGSREQRSRCGILSCSIGSMGKRFGEHATKNLGSREQKGSFCKGAGSTDPPLQSLIISMGQREFVHSGYSARRTLIFPGIGNDDPHFQVCLRVYNP